MSAADASRGLGERDGNLQAPDDQACAACVRYRVALEQIGEHPGPNADGDAAWFRVEIARDALARGVSQ